MPNYSRSSAAFLERTGIAATRRAPVPRMLPSRHPLHTYPVAPPKPLAHYLHTTQGSPPPDRGRTEPWPHGAR